MPPCRSSCAMATLASGRREEWSPSSLYARSCDPEPGRLAAVARIATCCTIVVATGMLYQIPEPT